MPSVNSEILKNSILILLICDVRNCINFFIITKKTNIIFFFSHLGSEVILSSCCCQSNRATNVGNVMPHPGQAFLKNDAKRKREYEIYCKNCRENIKRWKQSANSSTFTTYIIINNDEI